ncbi:MAG: sugar ABC transporter ATP-binding protein [Chloroflexi bacterium]|nr:sugar ABC transporter ATP-binding protein [Chloroflexota bacterium]
MDHSSPGSGSALPLISATGICKHYAGVTALDHASFSCQTNSIHALLGGNGAGKSTLIKILAGVVAPDAGELLLDGKSYVASSPQAAVRHGIVSVFQELSLVPDLTVAENIFIANPPRGRLGLIDRHAMNRQVDQLFAELGFHHLDPEASVSDLSLSDRQLVEIAKAVALKPKLLILDEGTSALSGHEVELVFEVLRRIRSQDRSVIYISHRMDEVAAIADTMTIYRDGRDMGCFPVGSLSSDEIVQLMIGRKLGQVFPPKPSARRDPPPAPVLEARGLSWEAQLDNISFTLCPGEIVGLGGLNGQGQGELISGLFGLLSHLRGTILVDGRVTNIDSPEAAAHAKIGLALTPAERKTEGLILPMSVGDNITLTLMDRLARLGFVQRAQEQTAIQSMIEKMRIKVSSTKMAVGGLSGGNQQKVVIAKWLSRQARVYLLHDPTRGIDVGTKQELYRLIRSLADEGAAILLFSTDVTELIGLCDRVLIMYEGKIIREVVGDDISEQNLVSGELGLTGS